MILEKLKHPGLGITLRTTLLSWLVTVATLLIFVGVSIPQQKRIFLEYLESKASGVAVSLHDVAASDTVNEDYSSVVSHCTEMLKGDPSLDYIIITKNDGFSLICDRTGKWRVEDKVDKYWWPDQREPASGIGTVPLFNRRVFHYSKPLDYSGIQWGWIHVGLSLQSYDRNVDTVYKRTGLLAVGCILLSLLASGLYASWLVRPILALRQVVRKVADGDLSVRAKVDRGDELGQLATSVNSMTEALLHRDRILQSVRFAAQQFLSTSKWDAVIPEVLRRIGEAAEASRIYVYENLRREAHPQLACRRFEWAGDGIPPQMDHPALREFSWSQAGCSQWARQLESAESVAVSARTWTPAERAVLEPQGVRSLLLIPIVVENTWWGCLGLDECHWDRQWTEAERDSLRAAADMLGAAITRQRTQDALLRAKEAAEAASQAKSQFLANMSHEIRTPITGVLGMLQLLQRTGLDKHQTRYAANASTSASTLLTVIGDVLDFSKIEAGKMELDEVEFDPVEVVDTVVRLFAERAEDKGIELVYRMSEAVPRQLRGDSNRLRQILLNLVGNAVKFTNQGEVVVNCDCLETSAAATTLRFETRDTGCGIAPEKQQLIFDPFSQADNSMTRRYGGTGLGLTISRQFCELMGGRLSVESTLGVGSTFRFVLPFKPAPAALALAAAPLLDLRGLRVLVVDDCATTREINQAWIARWQGQAETAAEALQALDQLRRAARSGQPFQVAVLDWKMPGMDGLALARAIQEDPQLEHTGLVLLSSFTQQGGADQILAAGFAAFIPKPAGQSDLYDAIVAAANGDCKKTKLAWRPEASGASVASLAVTGTVLLAEDNEINREVALEILSALGCQCRWVRNGREALAAWQKGPMDLILMDCQMPEMDGYEATRAIRGEEGRHPHQRRIPIVALTAHATKGDRDRCLAAGMDDYLTKPLDPDLLAATLVKWLRPSAAAPDRPLERTQAEPIDYPSLLRRCMGKPELAARLVRKLTEQAEQDLQAVDTAVQQNDAAALAVAAHRLKGAAANVSAANLRQAALDLEHLGRAGNLAAAAPLVEKLRQELARLKGAAEQPACQGCPPGT